MKQLKTLVVVVFALLIPTLITACGNGSSHQITMGAILFAADPFFQGVQQGMQAEADKNHVKLLVSTHNHDQAKEADFMNTYTTQKVDAILVTPNSTDASVSAIRTASQAGIPVICFNTCIDPTNAQKYVKADVETDQTSLGQQTGQWAHKYIANTLGGKANIAILNCDIYEACQQRKAGFKNALADLPGVKYVIDQQGFDVDKAATVAENELQGHPEINLMWASNEGGTEGEVVAVKSQNLAGKVAVVGTDISTQLAQYLLDANNILQATTGQAAQQMGAEAVDDALQSIHGKAITPFTQNPPNAFYSRDDLSAVRKYLGQ